jgi:hypothetical protein
MLAEDSPLNESLSHEDESREEEEESVSLHELDLDDNTDQEV